MARRYTNDFCVIGPPRGTALGPAISPQSFVCKVGLHPFLPPAVFQLSYRETARQGLTQGAPVLNKS